VGRVAALLQRQRSQPGTVQVWHHAVPRRGVLRVSVQEDHDVSVRRATVDHLELESIVGERVHHSTVVGDTQPWLALVVGEAPEVLYYPPWYLRIHQSPTIPRSATHVGFHDSLP